MLPRSFCQNRVAAMNRALFILFSTMALFVSSVRANEISFERDIRPIFSLHCVGCHAQTNRSQNCDWMPKALRCVVVIAVRSSCLGRAARVCCGSEFPARTMTNECRPQTESRSRPSNVRHYKRGLMREQFGPNRMRIERRPMTNGESIGPGSRSNR